MRKEKIKNGNKRKDKKTETIKTKGKEEKKMQRLEDEIKTKNGKEKK